ncbi:MAG: hypothetical protein AB4040_05975 [Synechococcus sp.]
MLTSVGDAQVIFLLKRSFECKNFSEERGYESPEAKEFSHVVEILREQALVLIGI